ncbi:alpha/beta fold hydrolase [Streptomyces sp. XD-27]|uniref:alpha/beta fold hydrolase n=1 Tax=Streptomyces sp. XD-27 TaxID=3062779 RepID=UPI0026F4177B|nr:alpha/beta hydrolase [Streptomyces sp. XD-27]WKX70748.1 alpha/beta hydrolase [Streptomyces sp. XD-27]
MGHLYGDGRRLFLHRSGSGGPAVVFLPGGGMVGLDYLNIHDAAAEFTTSVLYDRAGTGWSDQVPLPRTGAEVTDELRRLLHAAGVPTPYVLVGHSLGGAYARHYAQRFPDDVAGLLLMEPAHEDWDAHMPDPRLMVEVEDPHAAAGEGTPEPGEELLQQIRDLFTQMLAGWPAPIRERLVDLHLDPVRGCTGPREKNFRTLYGELRRAGDTPDVPTIVLTAMALDPMMSWFMPEQLERQMNEGKRALYEALAASVPHGENRVLDDAGHSWLHVQRPDAVLQAIRDLLDRADK